MRTRKEIENTVKVYSQSNGLYPEFDIKGLLIILCEIQLDIRDLLTSNKI